MRTGGALFVTSSKKPSFFSHKLAQIRRVPDVVSFWSHFTDKAFLEASSRIFWLTWIEDLVLKQEMKRDVTMYDDIRSPR